MRIKVESLWAHRGMGYFVADCTLEGGDSIELRIYSSWARERVGKVMVGDICMGVYNVRPWHKHLKRIISVSYGSTMDVFLFRKSLCNLK